jgi:hypothetical protein
MEAYMAQTREQIHEGLQLRLQIIALEDAGKYEEAQALRKAKIPLPPYTAKLIRDQIGVEYLRNSGYDLSLAEAKFGKDWLDRPNGWRGRLNRAGPARHGN